MLRTLIQHHHTVYRRRLRTEAAGTRAKYNPRIKIIKKLV
jgi:hypothetical protein